jgi:hypothetical protein
LLQIKEVADLVRAGRSQLDCFVAYAPRNDGDAYGRGLSDTFPAALRRQSRHRQSSPSSGIGRRAVSSEHQHGPARLQVNSVPHLEQLRRREAGTSNLFVINPTELSSSCPVHAGPRYSAAPIYAQGLPKGNPMARDSQTALIALNRFGFGARGGASGDLVNAASDPRGFVKAELSRPNGVLLEMPGLQSTPALAEAVFAYQAEVKLAREAAAKSAAPASEANPAPPPADAKAQRRSLSLNSVAMEMSGKDPAMKPPDSGNANATMAATEAMRPDAMQPNAPKPPPQPLNVILKTYRA